jgi:putative SOS response-associated peptidase YedK
MCTNYTPSTRHEIAASRLGVGQLPPEQWPDEVFPGYRAPIVIRGEPGQPNQCIVAQFGLVPRWCRDTSHAQSLSRMTYNARSETVHSKPSFREAWREGKFAIAPMRHYFEPCWENVAHSRDRSVRWRIGVTGAELVSVAGLWERWIDPLSGECADSFTLLTVNADGHAVMGRMHKPGEEKRMPAIVAAGEETRWLQATASEAKDCLQPFDAALMFGEPDPLRVAQTSANLPLF